MVSSPIGLSILLCLAVCHKRNNPHIAPALCTVERVYFYDGLNEPMWNSLCQCLLFLASRYSDHPCFPFSTFLWCELP
jgi:hypothetical protein